MAVKTIHVRQGDTSDIQKVRPTQLTDGAAMDANWTCKTVLLDQSFTPVFTARNVTDKTDDETRFIVALNPDDTAGVTLSKNGELFTWVIQLTNTTTIPPFNKEIHLPVNILKQGIA
jgi:hypothetical protein